MIVPVKSFTDQCGFFIQNQYASLGSTLFVTLHLISMQDPSVAVRGPFSVKGFCGAQEKSVVVKTQM